MIGAIQNFFDTRIKNPVGDADPELGYQLATAALLFEVARADNQVQSTEEAAVAAAINKAFALPPAETESLLALARTEAEEATSLYEFTRLINDHFSAPQKSHVVELLWRVALADGDLDKYEEHLIRKVADLLYVPNRQLIQTKLRVLQEADPN